MCRFVRYDVMAEGSLDVPSVARAKVAEMQRPRLAAVECVRLVTGVWQDAQSAPVECPGDLAPEGERLLEQVQGIDRRGPGVDLRLLSCSGFRLEVPDLFPTVFTALDQAQLASGRRLDSFRSGIIIYRYETGRSRSIVDAGVANEDIIVEDAATL